MPIRNPTLRFTCVSAQQQPPAKWCFVLHGILGSGGNFRAVAREFTGLHPEWGAVLVDLRMHGRSQGFAPPHNLQTAAADLTQLLTEVPGPVRGIMGHSYGGKVALRYLKDHGEELERAWILDSNPASRPDRSGSASTLSVVDMLERAPARFNTREAFLQYVQSEGHAPGIAQWLAMNLDRTEDGYAFRLSIPAVRELLDDYFETDLWSAVTQSRARVDLVIAGESDVFSAADRQYATQVADESSGRVRVHTLEGAGHWLHVDDPQGLQNVLGT